VGKVLADAAASREHVEKWCGDRGFAWRVSEFAMELHHQGFGGRQNRPRGREAITRIVGERVLHALDSSASRSGKEASRMPAVAPGFTPKPAMTTF
jgi:hypothetical protein